MGRLEVVAGEEAETAGIDRQALRQAELHAEIGDRLEDVVAMVLAEPARRRARRFFALQEPGDALAVFLVRGELLEFLGAGRQQHQPRVPGEGEQVRVEFLATGSRRCSSR